MQLEVIQNRYKIVYTLYIIYYLLGNLWSYVDYGSASRTGNGHMFSCKKNEHKTGLLEDSILFDMHIN